MKIKKREAMAGAIKPESRVVLEILRRAKPDFVSINLKKNH